MLMELIPKYYTLPFGAAKIRLRYTLASFLNLEKRGLTYKVIFGDTVNSAVLRDFLIAGLMDKIDDTRIDKIIDIMGSNLLTHIQQAVLLALPQSDPLSIELPSAPSQDGDDVDYKKLYTLFVDIMQRPDSEFWQSTLGEIIDRWQSYSICKGFSKPPKRMKLYDDD